MDGVSSRESNPKTVDRRIGKFDIVRRIGAGGMGIVYEARDSTLDRVVALKVLPPESSASQARQRRMQREARSLAALAHPNIATIYEVGEAEGTSYIAMELVEGRSLKQRLGGRGLQSDDAIRIFGQIADALQHAHDAGIIHRDLKPSNVVLTPGGDARLLDFGIAKVLEEAPSGADGDLTTQEGQILGTPEFMSPEQARGDRTDHRSDIFAFGSLMYAVLSGSPPFQEQTPHETVVAVYRRTPRHLSEVAPAVQIELANIVHRCLRKDPDARYQRADAIRMDLQLLSPNATETVLDSRAPVRTAASELQRARRRRVQAIAGALVLALTAIAVVAGLRWMETGEIATQQSETGALFVERRLTDTGHASAPLLAKRSPDRKLIAYSSPTAVWLGDATTLEFRRITDARPGFLFADFSPDSETLVVAGIDEDASGRAWRLPVGGGRAEMIYEGPPLHGLHASLDGRSLLIANRHGLVLYDIESKTSKEVATTPSTALVLGRLSPDGAQVAYVVLPTSKAYTTGSGSVWIANSDGTASRKLATLDGLNLHRTIAFPIWIGESALAFTRFNAGSELVSLDWSAGPPRFATLHTWPNAGVTIVDGDGDGGSYLAIKESATSTIKIATLNTSQTAFKSTKSISPVDREAYAHTWAPDGRLVVASGRPSNANLYLLAQDGIDRELLVKGVTMRSGLATVTESGLVFWRRDGDRLAAYHRDWNAGRETPLTQFNVEEAPEVQCAAGNRSRCILRLVRGESLEFRQFDPSTGQASEVLLSRPFGGERGWALSADGARIAHVVRGGQVAVESFDSNTSRLLRVKPGANLQYVTWDVREDRLFVTAGLSPGGNAGGLFTTDLEGNTNALVGSMDAVLLPIVSPDGKRLAFTSYELRADLWALERASVESAEPLPRTE